MKNKHTKNKHTKSKLAAYSALAAAALAIPSSSKAQTVYVDLVPDVNGLDWDSPEIDINGDGWGDIFFWREYDAGGDWSDETFQVFGSSGLLISYVVDSDVWAPEWPYLWCTETLTATAITVPKLDAGDVISPAGQFIGSAYLMKRNHYASCWGDFDLGSWLGGATDKYFGFQVLLEDGEYHSGWMRLDFSEAGVGYANVDAYAYQLTPGTPIVAGDTFDLQSCAAPAILSITSTPTSVKVFWNAVDYADHYKLWYRVQGAGGPWTKLNLGATTQKKITGLACNTTYEFKVAARCNADATIISSSFSDVQTQTTGVCRMEGVTMADETSIWTDGSNLFVSFDALPDAVAQLSIASLQGQLVYSCALPDIENTIPLDLPKGMYLAIVVVGGEKVVSKVIID